MYGENRILSVKGLILHLDSAFLAQHLLFRRHVVIMYLRFVNEMIRPVVSDRLVPFILWHQNFKDGFRVVSLVRLECSEAVIM